MTEEEQRTMDSLSANVTRLCEAIDPLHSHGPETVKIVAHCVEIRRTALYLSRRYGRETEVNLRAAANKLRSLLES